MTKDYTKILNGSIVKYTGHITTIRDRPVRIKAIHKTGKIITSYTVVTKDSQGDKIDFSAAPYELEHLIVSEQDLIKLGFINNPKDNSFFIESVFLVHPTYIEGKADSLKYVDEGFVAVTRALSLPYTKKDINNNSVSVQSMHILQNFLIGKILKIIDWDILL